MSKGLRPYQPFTALALMTNTNVGPSQLSSNARIDASSPTAIENPRRVRFVAVLLIAIGCLRLVPLLAESGYHNDFGHYYLGGWMLSTGLNPYTEPLSEHCHLLGTTPDPTIPYAAHPPMLLALFSLLANFSPAIAFGIWVFVQFAVFAAFLEVTRRLLNWRWSDFRWLVVVAVFCNATSVQRLFYYSQVQLLVATVLYLALLANLQRRHLTACGLLTLATAFKIFPVILVPWFFFSGVSKLSDVTRRTLVVCVVGVLCLLCSGVSTWHDFVTTGLPALSNHAVKWTNLSVQNLVSLLSYTSSGDLFRNHARTLGSVASVCLIGAAYLGVIVRRPPPKISFCVLLSAMTVGGVICWSHYFAMLLLPVALLWRAAPEMKSSLTRITAGVTGTLVLMPQLDSVFIERGGNSIARILLQFYPLFAVIMMGALLLLFHLPSSDTQPE